MNSNVVELKTRPLQLNQNAIELLEEYLERAKQGEIISVSIAGVTSDLSSISQWSESDNVQILLSAITILQHRLLKSITEE